jgi:hypothetical protein
MKKRIIAALMVVMLIIVPAIAIEGVGDIVYDPINYANALLMLAELIKNYEQLKSQLELQTWLSKIVPVNMAIRYRTLGADWYGLQLPYDRFGNLSGWIQAVNQSGGALAGYGGATVPLQSYGALGKLAPDEQQKTASQYASVELADGINVHSMETIGMLRGNASAVQQSIQSLEDDSLSLDPAMNTEIAVLNKINAASIASLRSSRDTNRALLSVLEQQVAESKSRRDAHVAEINTQIMRLERGDAAKAENTSTLTQSLQGFRWR